jgi:hypothetical protein
MEALLEAILLIGGAGFIGYLFGEEMGAKKTNRGKSTLLKRFLKMFGR